MAIRRKSARLLEDASPSPTEWKTPEPSVSYSKFRTKRLQTRLEEIEDTLYQLKVRLPAWRLLSGPVNTQIQQLGKNREDILLELSKRGRLNTDAESIKPREQAARGATAPAKSQRKSVVMPILERKGWSVLDWASRSCVDYNTASDYLKGKTRPYKSTLKKLADSLGIDVQKLPS